MLLQKTGRKDISVLVIILIKHFDLGGSGSTVEEAKKDCFTFYDEMKSEYPEENFPELEMYWVQVSNSSLPLSEPVGFSR